ncbi:MAG: restriction endonuclease [Chloroflexota bacterium]
MHQKDKDKLTKAGFATPRGGDKGAYQNHVLRSNKVIVPYERLRFAPLESYNDGYVIRLYPEQYFSAAGVVKETFIDGEGAWIRVGENAFVLYRTHEGFNRFPPLDNWSVRSLLRDGITVKERVRDVVDVGHYVLRLSALGNLPRRNEGPPQGIFAPEYADQETNYLSQCVLAWLIIHAVDSPYTTSQSTHLQAVLAEEGLLDPTEYEATGVMRHGLCECPLCLRFIRYDELHEMVEFDDAVGNENAAAQVEGATRSTIVNLFHLSPLRYDTIAHIPQSVAWGHAVCNSRLGQRQCVSLAEIIAMGLKVGIIRTEGIETFGWITDDFKTIRSPNGAVWIQLNGDTADGPPAGADEV